MIKITQTEKIRQNETMIMNTTKEGLAKGLSLRYIHSEIADELEVQYSTLNNFWYRNKWNDKLPDECKKMIKTGASKNQKELESSTETVIQSIESKENKKETVGKKIYTLVKQTNADLSHLQELYSIQGEEIKQQLKKGLKKIEDNQNSFSQSVSNKLNKMMELDQPQTMELDTSSAKFVVDYKSDVKVIEAPVELKYDEAKVNGLINEIETLEESNIQLKDEIESHMKNTNIAIEQAEKLMKRLDTETNSRKVSEAAYAKLQAEANFMQIELDKLKGELQYERELNNSVSNCNMELEQQIIRLNRENTELVNKNKLLNKRGLVDRLFNRDVEYSPVSN